MKPAIQKTFDLKGDNTVKNSTYNNFLNNKIVFMKKYGQKQFNDEKGAKHSYDKSGKTNEETIKKWTIKDMIKSGEVKVRKIFRQTIECKI